MTFRALDHTPIAKLSTCASGWRCGAAPAPKRCALATLVHLEMVREGPAEPALVLVSRDHELHSVACQSGQSCRKHSIQYNRTWNAHEAGKRSMGDVFARNRPSHGA